MKLQDNSHKKFINFWEFLEIPMNSPVGEIKIAFVNKFEKIKDSINKKDGNYSLEDLKLCINAYETLSNPYSRFLHNCEIDGEEPPRDPDWDLYFGGDGLSDDDLSVEDNQSFLAWLISKIKELAIQKDFKDIAKKLYELFIKENEKYEKKQQCQKNKKIMHK